MGGKTHKTKAEKRNDKKKPQNNPRQQKIQWRKQNTTTPEQKKRNDIKKSQKKQNKERNKTLIRPFTNWDKKIFHSERKSEISHLLFDSKSYFDSRKSLVTLC